MAEFAIIGGGLAGLAAAAALGGEGHQVTVLEARPFLGGRATSYPVTVGSTEEVIDNCQHVLLRCCVNLLDFYRRLGVQDSVRFEREFYFLEPGGRMSTMRAGLLPKPLHFAASFARLKFLSTADKIAVARGLLAVERQDERDLDMISMLDWLREQRQTPRAIERFWRQILVSAINEELDRMAAAHGLQVFRVGFLATKNSYEMGVPAVPLAKLYGAEGWSRLPQVRIMTRAAVTRVVMEGGRVVGLESGGGQVTADAYICALPFERVGALLPDLALPLSQFEHSPITGIHFWFDRAVTTLPHATLLDRTIQWFFNKDAGRYLQLVVSASRSLTEMPRQQVIDLALKELREFVPGARDAVLEKAQVIKEIRATFSARPGLEAVRPPAPTAIPNLFLAGDWTRSGWPATMEGAVRSGYLAAEATLGQAGRFLKKS